jgi:hypothetical protein
MSIALAMALAAVSSVQPSCSWDRPGANPYTGSTSAAIDRYTDIPEAVRSTLKLRLAEGLSDDQVNITRDGITGKHDYNPAIRDMHFGAASVCNTVTRGKWSAERVEPGAVYCVKEHCILVPKICGNVSRVARRDPKPVAALVHPGQSANGPNGPNGANGKSGNPDGSDQQRNLADTVTKADLGLTELDPGELRDLRADAGNPATTAAEEDLQPGAEQGQRQARASGGQAGSGEAVAEGPSDGVPELELDFDITDARGRMAGSFGRKSPFAITIDGANDETVIAQAVPEADSWAMLVSGLGLLGFIGRRARRRSK